MENSSKAGNIGHKNYEFRDITDPSKAGWIFQKSVSVTTGKTKISEKYLDEFSRTCHYGLSVILSDLDYDTLTLIIMKMHDCVFCLVENLIKEEHTLKT